MVIGTLFQEHEDRDIIEDMDKVKVMEHCQQLWRKVDEPGHIQLERGGTTGEAMRDEGEDEGGEGEGREEGEEVEEGGGTMIIGQLDQVREA